MRPIKFRAWDKRNNRWLSPFAITMFGSVIQRTYLTAYDWMPSSEGTENLTGHVDLMQFTGLKDKNGKEIYEGDIVRHEGGGSSIPIAWESQEWDEDGFHTGFHMTFTADQYEVVGNIYENPELLND